MANFSGALSTFAKRTQLQRANHLHGSTPLHEYDAMINFAFTMLDDKT
jgi:hypothetical protein